MAKDAFHQAVVGDLSFHGVMTADGPAVVGHRVRGGEYAGEVRWSLFFGQVVKLGSPLWRTDPMTGKRKRYLAEFKARVALEALRGELTVSQLATKHGVHQTLIGDWKRQAMDGLATVFSGKAEAQEGMREEDVEKLHAKIGQLVVERDFLAKASGR